MGRFPNPIHPWWCAGLFAAGAAAVLPAQQDPARQVETPIEFSTGQDDNLFSLLRSQEQIHAFEEGLAEIAAGEHRAGVERLHRLLQIENGGVVPVGPGRFRGLRAAVVTAMANLPPAAAAAYEQFVTSEGGDVGDLTTLPPDKLRLLAERFPTATVGRRARLRLGDLALTAGDALTAAGHFRSALDAATIGSAEERRVLARLYATATLLDPAAAHTAPGALAADDVLPVVPFHATDRPWPAYGGGRGGSTPMVPMQGRPDARWSESLVAPGFQERESGQFAMHAVGDLDGIYVHTGQSLVALDPLRKEISWVSLTPMSGYEDDDRPRGRGRGFGRGERSNGNGINEDMVLAAAYGDDVVVAALQVPEKSMTVDFNGGFRVMTKIPMRRLYGFARQSGKVVWRHYDDLDGPLTRRFRGHDACANPLVAGDTVYVPVHDRAGAIAFSIAAYDLATGAPKWRRLICSSQQDVNMFGNARAEFAASPLCLHDGVLYGASNLGTAFAVEATTGRLRWIAAYEVTSMPRTSFHQQQERQVFYANNAPVVAGGVVCLTPLDSPFVLGFDTESGRTLWQLPPDPQVAGIAHRIYWLAGALGDTFVLAGSGAVLAGARPDDGSTMPALRTLVRPDALGDRRNGMLPPRPAVTDDGVWFARADALYGVDRDGKPLAGSPVRMGRFLPGNLLLASGIVASLRQGSFEAAYDARALVDQVAAAAAAAPDDPALLLRLACLRDALLGADPTAAAAAEVRTTLEAGLAAAQRRGLPANHPVRLSLQRQLFQQARARAEAAMQRGSADALALLAAAREVAPDETQWIAMQAALLARCDAATFATELERLLTHAPDGTFPHGEGLPVRTWVTWQRARRETDPARAVQAWQLLLEQHGERDVGGQKAAELARIAIAALVVQHGAACYRAVQERAEAALQAAGDDRAALAAVTATFPNSTAAERARVRLLDVAVRAGDLAVACGVLAQELSDGRVAPGIARRVMVAARQRGNFDLATAMARLLQPHAATASDWPDDAGRSYHDVLADPALATSTGVAPAPARPLGDEILLRPGNQGELQVLLALIAAPGFTTPGQLPVYVTAERELRALDSTVATPRPPRFTAAVEYLEHVVLCGDTLIVPDMARLFAVDARTGAARWELPNPQGRYLESLGVQHGVLHVVAQPRTADADGELLAVEPLTGAVLWRRPQTANALKPKAVTGSLLAMTVAEDGASTITAIDPVTGAVQRSGTVAAATLRDHVQLQPDSLSTRFLPQSLLSDGERVFLPVDGAAVGDGPRLLAIAADGALAWHWRGADDGQLLAAAVRGPHVIVVEGAERRPARAVLLRSRDGAVLREIPIGHDAVLLNWERTWLDNPAPAALAFEAFADADRTTRQFVAIELDGADAGVAFVVPLGREDGEIAPAPQFGADFVAFVTRPGKGAGAARLWLLDRRDRSGLWPDGRKYRLLPDPKGIDVMTCRDGRLTLAGAQGILLLGPSRGDK